MCIRDRITDDQGLSIGRRRITVSTSGVVPQIGPLGEEMGTMLAISLHACLLYTSRCV